MPVAVSSFLVFAASQVGTPGPANMALMTTGARFGMRRTLPFLAGVITGKQLLVWPLGLGLLEFGQRVPIVFDALKWIAAAYVVWLAWRVAGSSLAPADGPQDPPGYAAGLLVHPLNPKAWAMITAGFTSFVSPGTPALQATATIAMCFLGCQIVLHPLWTLLGDRIALVVGDGPGERILMLTLAALTVASVAFVLFSGGTV